MDANNMFETIALYNNKHYDRMDKNYKNSFFVDYIVSQMSIQEEEVTKIIGEDVEMKQK